MIFPRFDEMSLVLALEKQDQSIVDAELSPLYDSVSECILEIEELKDELATIVMTQTSHSSGARDRWDTPDIKLPNGKKGKLRKDRYSSLIIANMLARQLTRTLAPIDYDIIGTNALTNTKQIGQMYKGPAWFTEQANEDIYIGIYK